MQYLYYSVTLYGKVFCRVMPGWEIDTAACKGHHGECRSWISQMGSAGNLYFFRRVRTHDPIWDENGVLLKVVGIFG